MNVSSDNSALRVRVVVQDMGKLEAFNEVAYGNANAHAVGLFFGTEPNAYLIQW